MSKPNIWFAGTPAFAAYSLEQLIEEDTYQVAGVLTQPDRPAGRGRKISHSAVKQTALAHGIAIEQPPKLKQLEPPFADLPQPDLVIVAAYGLLLPKWFLDYPRLGCLNIHASLLPRWRGAAPIQRALAAGDEVTGVTIMQMDEGLDTGAMWLSKQCHITPNMTAGELHDQLMHLGAKALLEALPLVQAQSKTPIPQNNDQATYAHKLSKLEAMIDWSQSAETIARSIRAYNPYPVSHTSLDNKMWRIFSAHAIHPNNQNPQPVGTIVAHDQQGIEVVCGDGHLCISEVQIAGKERTLAADLRHGHSIIGKRFSA